jgi:hypothetical protein
LHCALVLVAMTGMGEICNRWCRHAILDQPRDEQGRCEGYARCTLRPAAVPANDATPAAASTHALFRRRHASPGAALRPDIGPCVGREPPGPALSSPALRSLLARTHTDAVTCPASARLGACVKQRTRDCLPHSFPRLKGSIAKQRNARPSVSATQGLPGPGGGALRHNHPSWTHAGTLWE